MFYDYFGIQLDYQDWLIFEFDLEKMMEEELYNEFALLYRGYYIAHGCLNLKLKAEQAIIEQYHLRIPLTREHVFAKNFASRSKTRWLGWLTGL